MYGTSISSWKGDDSFVEEVSQRILFGLTISGMIQIDRALVIVAFQTFSMWTKLIVAKIPSSC